MGRSRDGASISGRRGSKGLRVSGCGGRQLRGGRGEEPITGRASSNVQEMKSLNTGNPVGLAFLIAACCASNSGGGREWLFIHFIQN